MGITFNTAGYQPIRTQTLPNGIYEMIIRSAEVKNNTNGAYIEVELQARGKKGWTPNKLFFNEAPVPGGYKKTGMIITEDDLKHWNREITRFFDCFGINPGNFDVTTWKGKIGFVKVAEQYDPNEPDKKSKKYKALFPQAPGEEEPAAPAPSAPAPTNNAVNAVEEMVNEYKPAPEGENPPAFNDEDIPFQ